MEVDRCVMARNMMKIYAGMMHEVRCVTERADATLCTRFQVPFSHLRVYYVARLGMACRPRPSEPLRRTCNKTPRRETPSAGLHNHHQNVNP